MKALTSLGLIGLLALSMPAHAAEPWEQEIATAIGKPGTEMPGGVYRVGLPRSDLHVMLDGVAIKPALALGSWLAFVPHGNGEVMVMGDLVLTDTEVNPAGSRSPPSTIICCATRRTPCICILVVMVLRRASPSSSTMRWR